MAEDWRFRSNPYTLVGICSYIGSAVSLRCDPLDKETSSVPRPEDLPDSLGIGAFNIMFVDDTHEVLTEQERMVVTNVTRMLVAQLRATWEGHIRTKEARARKAVMELIEEGFDSGRRSPQGQTRVAFKFPELVRSALDRLLAVTDLTGAALLDLRGICTIPGKEDLVFDSTSHHPISIIASTPAGTVQDITSPEALLSFLNKTDAPAVFASPDESGLETHLPQKIRAHILLPFFSLKQPVFLLVGISQHVPIPDSTLNIARSIGSILLSNIVQTRVVEADASKTAFLSSISHELRTPLYGLLASVELAQKTLQEGDAEGAVGMLDIAAASGLSLSHILNDVLDFARHEDRNAEGTGRVDLVAAVRHAAQMCMAQFKENEEAAGVVLECEQRMVTLHEAKYHRIIINGLTNAFKFCSAGTITISISYTEHLITRITDTGIGFDMNTLPHLLEPFTKQDQDTPGAGLGLHITKRLVESLGGTLTLCSEAGKGTTFEVLLPIAVDPSKGNIREVLQEARSPASPNPRTLRGLSATVVIEQASSKLRVLIVDDNAVCLKILHATLRRGKVPVDCVQAENGEEAVKMFEAFSPELVFTDVSMPVLNGVEAAKRMREVEQRNGWRRSVIYALTGLGSSDPRLKSVAIQGQAALDGWLVKGLDEMASVRRIVAEVEADRVRMLGS